MKILLISLVLVCIIPVISIFAESQIITTDSDFNTSSNYSRYLIFGASQNPLSDTLSQIQTKNGFFAISVLNDSTAKLLSSQGYHVMQDVQLDFHENDIGNYGDDVSRIGVITGADSVRMLYNSTGTDTKVAIVDTGVDFSNKDIRHSLARDDFHMPMMLDADGQGLIITSTTFQGTIDKYGNIKTPRLPLFQNATSSVYVTRDGVFLDMTKQEPIIQIYNSFFPQHGNFVTFNGTINHDYKIGRSSNNYIKSASGMYHFGVMYQGDPFHPQVVPVLVTDSVTPGVYNTITADLSTSYSDYTNTDVITDSSDTSYDFDFTDETPIILGSGDEFLLYDSDDDGVDDYYAGTVGARVLDVYGTQNYFNNSINGTNNYFQNDIISLLPDVKNQLLAPLDENGNFFGVMTDFMGHGTASAGSITSKGINQYNIYNNTKTYSITGVAPDTKIVPIKALWLGDSIYSWLWAAGFDNEINSDDVGNESKQYTWKYSGAPRVDVISNSWGISNFPNMETSPGMDILSLILSVLVTPHSIDEDYQGITIVSSAGNSGHGYGTIGLPNVSPYGISVGATTNNVFVGYGPFEGEPRFGNFTSHYNEVIDFSSRGPGIIGDPKPDLMSIGAYGFTPASIVKDDNLNDDTNDIDDAFTLFGGTSMAAPLVSGSAAILIEELKKNNISYDSFLVKNILMSTANDLNNDAFTQGSGLSDVSAALDYVYGKNGVFLVTNDSSYGNIKKILDPAMASTNSTSLGFADFKLSTKSYPMTSWFAGQLFAGERSGTTWSITNPSDDYLEIQMIPQKLTLVKQNSFDGTTEIIPDETSDGDTKDNVYLPNFLNLSDIGVKTLNDLYDKVNSIPDSSLMVLNVNFPFESFMNKTATVYADDIKISSLYLYDWVDENKDDVIDNLELSLINRAGSWGTVQELRVGNPDEKFDGTPLVGIYPVPTRFSYWQGNTMLNSTSMDYSVLASYYSKETWPLIWNDSSVVTVPPHETVTVNSTLVVSDDMTPGIYQGFMQFKGEQHTANAPVSFVVKNAVTPNIPIFVNGTTTSDVLYNNGSTKGAFDMSNRYMAGDWRQYYFDVQDDSINSAAVEISWENKDTNLSVFVMGPDGSIISSNVPSGVFGHFMEWPSLDWLGNSLFSQGGGFFPVKNKDDYSTVLQIPINQTGTHTILTHTTLFAGDTVTEPLTLVAKFTDILSSPKVPPLLPISESIPELTATEISPTPTITDEFQNVTQKNIEDSLTVGLIIGLSIGLGVGVICVFVFRSKTHPIKQGL